MPPTYTVTMNAREHAVIVATLIIHLSHLEKYAAAFDRPGDESERQRINTDIDEVRELLNMLDMLKNTKQE